MPELQQILLEHRRALLEKLIQVFPDVLKTHRSVVDLWRLRLKSPAIGTECRIALESGQ